MAPLVAEAFARYATRTFTLRTLAAQMRECGLVNQRGGHASVQTLSSVLNNPFYTGVIRTKRTGALYAGLRTPLIPSALFDQVQSILRAKSGSQLRNKQCLLYRRLITCVCGRYLVGEKQKGHVYYRCHSPGCRTSVREERLEEAFVHHLWVEISQEIAEVFVASGMTTREAVVRSYTTGGRCRDGSFFFVRPPDEVIQMLQATLMPKTKGPPTWRQRLLHQQTTN